MILTNYLSTKWTGNWRDLTLSEMVLRANMLERHCKGKSDDITIMERTEIKLIRREVERRRYMANESGKNEIGWYVSDVHCKKAIIFLTDKLIKTGYLPGDTTLVEMLEMWGEALGETVDLSNPSPIGPERELAKRIVSEHPAISNQYAVINKWWTDDPEKRWFITLNVDSELCNIRYDQKTKTFEIVGEE